LFEIIIIIIILIWSGSLGHCVELY